MKWDPRKPSLKAPRGFGWVTDPKKALCNRIYFLTKP